jgi:hypothetical protein
MLLAASHERRPEQARRYKRSILDGYGPECEFVTRFTQVRLVPMRSRIGHRARLSPDLRLLNPQDVIATLGLSTHG